MHVRRRHLLRTDFAFALALSLAAFALPARAFAQAATLTGTVVDRGNQRPLANARVRATALPETTQVQTTATDESGQFRMELPAGRSYRVDIARLDYAPW